MEHLLDQLTDQTEAEGEELVFPDQFRRRLFTGRSKLQANLSQYWQTDIAVELDRKFEEIYALPSPCYLTVYLQPDSKPEAEVVSEFTTEIIQLFDTIYDLADLMICSTHLMSYVKKLAKDTMYSEMVKRNIGMRIVFYLTVHIKPKGAHELFTLILSKISEFRQSCNIWKFFTEAELDAYQTYFANRIADSGTH